MKKHILGTLFSLCLLLSPVFTPPAEAASLTSVQVSAIVTLLQVLGVDQSVINTIQAALGGTTVVVPPPVVIAPTHKLPPTGITSYANLRTIGAVDASVAADTGAFPRQDARYARPFDYTKIANDGSTLLLATATLGTGPKDWACTKDNITGLIWEVKTTSGLRNKDNTYTWYNSDSNINGGDAGTASGGTCTTTGRCDTEKFVADVNGVGLCGHSSSWRLPTVKELESIANFELTHSVTTIDEGHPAIDTNYFPNTPGNLFFTSTLDSILNVYVWVVDGYSGAATSQVRHTPLAVRLVWTGSPASSVHDASCSDTNPIASNPDNVYDTTTVSGTAIDTRYGLMWQRCSVGQTWNGSTCTGSAQGGNWGWALQQSVLNKFAGFTDWRVPNVKELRSLVEECRFNPSINETAFPNAPAVPYYSSSLSNLAMPVIASWSWTVDFSKGAENYIERFSGVPGLRLVRDVTIVPVSPTAPTATLTINGQPSVTNADPLVQRTWAWSGTPGATYSASGNLTGCDTASQNGPQQNWTPWTDIKATGNATNGSSSATPGAVKYGCVIVGTYNVTKDGQTTTSTATITYRHADGSANTTVVDTGSNNSGGLTVNITCDSTHTLDSDLGVCVSNTIYSKSDYKWSLSNVLPQVPLLTANASGPLTITTNSLRAIRSRSAWKFNLTSTGGGGIPFWSLVSGSLPPTMELYGNRGVIVNYLGDNLFSSGNTAIPAGVYTFTVKVTVGSQSATKQLSIEVIPDSDKRPIIYNPDDSVTFLNNLPINNGYGYVLSHSPIGIPVDYKDPICTLLEGDLASIGGSPDIMRLIPYNGHCMIFGTPRVPGDYKVKYKITNDYGSDIGVLSFKVQDAPFLITGVTGTMPAELIVGVPMTPVKFGYYNSINSTPEVKKYLDDNIGYHPSDITIPGLSIEPRPSLPTTGVVSGIPTTAGTYKVRIETGHSTQIGTRGVAEFTVVVKPRTQSQSSLNAAIMSVINDPNHPWTTAANAESASNLQTKMAENGWTFLNILTATTDAGYPWKMGELATMMYPSTRSYNQARIDILVPEIHKVIDPLDWSAANKYQSALRVRDAMIANAWTMADINSIFSFTLEGGYGEIAREIGDVVNASAAPHLATLSPASGKAGTTVTVSGFGFTGNNDIYMDGVLIDPATVSRSGGPTPTWISFVIPGNLPSCPAWDRFCTSGPVLTPGTYTVSVQNTNGTSNSLSLEVN